MNLPLHESPLLARVYPLWQLQTNDPTLFVHVWAHPPLLLAHSFTSVCVEPSKWMTRLLPTKYARYTIFVKMVLFCTSVFTMSDQILGYLLLLASRHC